MKGIIKYYIFVSMFLCRFSEQIYINQILNNLRVKYINYTPDYYTRKTFKILQFKKRHRINTQNKLLFYALNCRCLFRDTSCVDIA